MMLELGQWLLLGLNEESLLAVLPEEDNLHVGTACSLDGPPSLQDLSQ
jgi:hypothetical protein